MSLILLPGEANPTRGCGVILVLNFLRLKLSKDPAVRRAAASSLGEKRDTLSVKALIGALADSDGKVRQSAAEALGKLEDARAIEPLVAMCRHPLDQWDQRHALAALAKIGDDRAFEFLVGLLKPSAVDRLDSDSRISVAAGLSRIGDARAVTPLMPMLANASTAVRRAAVESLTSLGWTPTSPSQEAIAAVARSEWDVVVRLGQLAVEPLLHALRDFDNADSLEAAKTLGRLGAQGVQPLIALITERSPVDKAKVIEALGVAGPVAISPLFNALKREKAHQTGLKTPKTVAPLLAALKEIGSPTVGWMAEALANGEEPDRYTAAEILGILGDTSSVPTLTTALIDPNSSVRWSAANALKGLGCEPAEQDDLRPVFLIAAQEWDEAIRLGERSLQPLLAVLSDANVSWQAARALGRTGDSRAFESLAQLLSDHDSMVRQVAVEALGNFRDMGVERLLRERVRDPDLGVRLEIATTLGKLATPAAIPGLVDELSDTDDRVRQRAADGLTALGWEPSDPIENAAFAVAQHRWTDAVGMGETASAALVRAHEDPEFNIRVSAAEALVEIGHIDDVITTLLMALQKSDQKVRCRAAKALGKTRDPVVCEPLEKALLDTDGAVQHAASVGLIHVGGAAVNALTAVLRTSNSHGKWLAVEALGEIGTAEVVEPLIGALAIRNDTGSAAARALGRIGDARAVEPLINALSNSPDLVCGAAEALGRFGDPRAVMPLLAALPGYGGDNVSKRDRTRAITTAVETLADKSLTDLDIRRIAMASVKEGLCREAQDTAFNLLAKRDPSWVTQQSVRDELLEQTQGDKPVDRLVGLLNGGARALACFRLIFDHGREGLAHLLARQHRDWHWLSEGLLARDDAALVPELREWLSLQKGTGSLDGLCRCVALLTEMMRRKKDELPIEELRALALLHVTWYHLGEPVDHYDLKEWTGRTYVGGYTSDETTEVRGLARSILTNRGAPISDEATVAPN